MGQSSAPGLVLAVVVAAAASWPAVDMEAVLARCNLETHRARSQDWRVIVHLPACRCGPAPSEVVELLPAVVRRVHILAARCFGRTAVHSAAAAATGIAQADRCPGPYWPLRFNSGGVVGDYCAERMRGASCCCESARVYRSSRLRSDLASVASHVYAMWSVSTCSCSR